MDTNNRDSVFKVIVVGGGPIGLTAAHALHLAGIDFVVLERRPNIVEDKGASLIVYPHTFRVMHQFGILEALLSAGSELRHHLSLTVDGYAFKEGTRYERVPTIMGLLLVIAYFSGPERSWFFLYKKLAKPTRERVNYTDQDIEAVAEEFAGYPLTKTVKVKYVWPHMSGADMTNLDEGIVQHWSLGRIVLAGDSCHKLTTHLGLGFNNGVQDIVVLCNMLREVICATPNGNLDLSSLSQQLFGRYETLRKGPTSSLMAAFAHSGQEARMQAWASTIYHLIYI